MKIRSGFVSNSSSSSFVFIGVVVDRGFITREKFVNALYPGNDYDEDEIYDVIAENFCNDTDHGAPRGKTMIGKKITVSDSGWTNLNNPNFGEFMEEVMEMIKAAGLENEPLQIISGTQMS